jgi:hypothetical protein
MRLKRDGAVAIGDGAVRIDTWPARKPPVRSYWWKPVFGFGVTADFTVDNALSKLALV